MSALLTLDRAELAFGAHPLLDAADLRVEAGERIGLIGRNGTGKSTLLRVLAGAVALDDGELRRDEALRVVLVEQEPELPAAPTVHQALVERGAFEGESDERERWRREARLGEFLQRFEVDPGADPAALSGGQTKRAALALALALEPDLLLLDEPTNHLDIDGIDLLESLLGRVGAAIVITHDRAFLDRVATRIVELDRGLLRSYGGNFADYQRRKADELDAEATQARKFDRFWKQEEAWIRQGIKARRTRDEGRVRRLEALREQRAARRQRLGDVKIKLDAGARSGRLVAELLHVDKAFGDTVICRDLSTTILRGDRVGLIGPNGIGKSTLIRLMLGQEPEDAGQVRLGTKLQVAYFDQLREQLDPDATLVDTISPGSEWIESGGRRVHVMSYLGDFLFPPQRAQSPVKTLSGGERNRLLLARLFAQPANLLVLDEPTNDLDIESLELLEDTLQSYDGTLLLVSHDRSFLDNVVTQTLVAEGDGHWQEYAGGYSDWLQKRPERPVTEAATRAAVAEPAGKPATRRPGKLSFKEKRELEALPDQIHALEEEQAALLAKMSAPDYHREDPAVLAADKARVEALPELLEQKFARWAELDERESA
jgi:ATP-binding cassette subfamily F protein uup